MVRTAFYIMGLTTCSTGTIYRVNQTGLCAIDKKIRLVKVLFAHQDENYATVTSMLC